MTTLPPSLQEQVKGFLASRDNLIILIDGRENMFQRNAEGKVRGSRATA